MALPLLDAGAAIASTMSNYWYATHAIAITIYATKHVYNWVSPTVVVKTNDIEMGIIKEAEDGWLDVELTGKKPSIIQSIPRIKFQFPSSTQVAERVLTTLILDVPVYTIKSVYQSPILTTLILYYMRVL